MEEFIFDQVMYDAGTVATFRPHREAIIRPVLTLEQENRLLKYQTQCKQQSKREYEKIIRSRTHR